LTTATNIIRRIAIASPAESFRAMLELRFGQNLSAIAPRPIVRS